MTSKRKRKCILTVWEEVAGPRGTRSKETKVKKKNPNEGTPRKAQEKASLNDFELEDGDPYTYALNKSQNDYLREFLTRRPKYLLKLMELESAPDALVCNVCQRTGVFWRCLDCFGGCIACTGCLRKQHKRLPFHRVQSWDGDCFQPAWLYQAGVEIYLGHDGEPCPSVEQTSVEALEGDGELPWGPGEGMVDGEEEWEDEPEYDPVQSTAGAGFPLFKKRHHKLLVDQCGVHPMKVTTCRCVGAESDDIQFMDMGLFPASFQNVETAFTFGMLDNIRLENLECKTALRNIWNRLKRSSAPLQPDSVPNRYRELMRVFRQWRNLKLRKWFGFAYRNEDPGPGELAAFCAACPQPGVNLKDGWEQDAEMYKYSRDLVLDGNFSADQIKMKRPEDDVHLTDGDGFMVRESTFQEHLRTAKVIKQTRSCSNYNAIERANQAKAHLLYTGIGAAACARHGCFVPHAVVNFTKGEKYINMDWSLFCATTYRMTGIKRSAWYYDIMCQYWINLRKRFQQSPLLALPEELEILRGIGLFHVHGHKDDCFAKFAPTYIPGAGLVDGEILETLWAVLNRVSESTRTQAISFRRETLDDHMNDSNWKKLTKIVHHIMKKLKGAVGVLIEATNALNSISASATPTQIRSWKGQEATAQNNRWDDPNAMNIYNVKIARGVSKAQQQVDLLEKERQRNEAKGESTLMAEGLRLQEDQLHLAALIRRIGRSPTLVQALEIAQRRQRLAQRIEQYQRRAAIMWPIDIDEDIEWNDEDAQVPALPPASELDTDSEDEEEDMAQESAPSGSRAFAEKLPLSFPSTLGPKGSRSRGYQRAVRMEKALRIGQANDALQSIRTSIARKAVVFRDELRPAKGKKKKAQGWDHIHAVDVSVRHNARVYNKARNALLNLSPAAEDVEKYKELKSSDLNVNTARMDSTLRNHRGKHLAWFWTMEVAGDSAHDDGMLEFYRVHWLKASARAARCAEEVKILRREAESVWLYFLRQSVDWQRREDLASISEKLSQKAKRGMFLYARRRSKMWSALAADALDHFQKGGELLDAIAPGWAAPGDTPSDAP